MITPVVLPWPLHSSLEAATRALFDPADAARARRRNDRMIVRREFLTLLAARRQRGRSRRGGISDFLRGTTAISFVIRLR